MAHSLSVELLKPLLYADIFDYPLTFVEIYRFLEVETSEACLKQALEMAVNDGVLSVEDGYYSLGGRSLVNARRERQALADALWPEAVSYGRWIATLPFVRFVAVTGSLAVDNPSAKSDDIDYLIVTEPGRLWFCRALIVQLVRLGRLRGVHLCPNYLITENLLHFEKNSLFVARELVQMVPLFGEATYDVIRERNGWITRFLPQGAMTNGHRLNDSLSIGQLLIKRASELLFSGWLGQWFEQPLQRTQINKHRRLAQARGAEERVIFTADQCKGHYDGHQNRVMDAYQERLSRYRGQLNADDILLTTNH